MGHSTKLLSLVFLFATSRTSAVTLDLQLVTGSVTNPVFVTHAGDDSGRLFIVEQNGRIKIFDVTTTNLLSTPFLNIANLTLFAGEQGLLSMAFHPGYKTNVYFYVYFTNPDGSSNVVARFTASPPSAHTVNTNTMQTVLRISHPTNDNHNGGQLQFGPVGYLYIGTGDGGSGCDPPNNAQNLGSLLGKLLRIDVNNFSTNYTIPPSNPFVGVAGLDEIWAYGLRNPWRFSFDRLTGDMLIGDVGQDSREEVDFQPASSIGGENYGWKCMEGSLTNGFCSDPNCATPQMVRPILEYVNGSPSPCAIMGGYRYRGTKIPPLYGTYLYADECSGEIFGATQSLAGAWSSVSLTDTVFTVTTFGEDQAGEVYLSRYATAGAIYRIVWKDTDGDGMADDWEQQYFGSTTGANASADPDGDGFTNLQEFLAGTDPTSSTSALRITSIAPDNGDYLVTFTSATNKLYRLERTDDLVAGVWTTITNNILGTGGAIPITDVGAAAVSNRFYRARLLP